MLTNPITRDKTELTLAEQAEQDRLQRILDDLNRQIAEVAAQIQNDLALIGLRVVIGDKFNVKDR